MYRVNEEVCTGCGACVDECSLEAIALVAGSAYIDATKCTECDLCTYACPVDAVYEVVLANGEGVAARDVR